MGNIEHQIRTSRLINILGNLTCADLLTARTLDKTLNTLFSFKKELSTSDPLRSMLLSELIRNNAAPKNLKVVHIIRDPRDFVTSFMNWKKQSLKRTILHHAIPFWQPNPYLSCQITLKQWYEMDKFEHFSWVWNYKNRIFSEISNNCEYRSFRFEDIFGGNDLGNEELCKLSNYLNINIPQIDIDSSSYKINSSKIDFPKWRSWSTEQAKILDKHCGEFMHKYDYGNEPEWKALINT